jgi:ribonuclease HI
MAAALEGLQWLFSHLLQPHSITLLTDSTVVYYTLVKGTGVTLRRSLRLQNLFVNMFRNKVRAGHGLVTSWIPNITHANAL